MVLDQVGLPGSEFPRTRGDKHLCQPLRGEQGRVPPHTRGQTARMPTNQHPGYPAKTTGQ